MGIDATVPFGYENDFLRPVYAVEQVDLNNFFSEKDIANAISFFCTEDSSHITGQSLHVNGGIYQS